MIHFSITVCRYISALNFSNDGNKQSVVEYLPIINGLPADFWTIYTTLMECLKVVCKIPLLARALGLKAERDDRISCIKV